MLRLIYDTEFCPLSHDIVNTLAIIRGLLLLQKHDNPKFQVYLLNRKFRDIGIEKNYTDSYQKQKFRDVLYNVVDECKWVDTLRVLAGDELIPSFKGKTIPDESALRQRGKVPEFLVTPMISGQLEQVYLKFPALDLSDGFEADKNSKSVLNNIFMFEKAITFFPRVSKFTPERNSNFNLFSEVAKRFKEKNYDIYFVPDIEDLRNDFSWKSFPGKPILMASSDIKYKIAVAELSKFNILEAGGSRCIFNFTKVPYLQLGIWNEDVDICSKNFFSRKGPKFGEQPPWVKNPSQHIVWRETKNLSVDDVFSFFISSKKN